MHFADHIITYHMLPSILDDNLYQVNRCNHQQVVLGQYEIYASLYRLVMYLLVTIAHDSLLH